MALAGLVLLTACPEQEEVQAMLADMAQKKAQAATVIRTKNYSTDGLLTAQAYFFDFSERVHLMKTDENARNGIRSLIEQTGASQFCATYVLSPRSWKSLQSYCGRESQFRCSPDMIEYQTAFNGFLKLVGPELAQQLKSACN